MECEAGIIMWGEDEGPGRGCNCRGSVSATCFAGVTLCRLLSRPCQLTNGPSSIPVCLPACLNLSTPDSLID